MISFLLLTILLFGAPLVLFARPDVPQDLSGLHAALNALTEATQAPAVIEEPTPPAPAITQQLEIPQVERDTIITTLRKVDDFLHKLYTLERAIFVEGLTPKGKQEFQKPIREEKYLSAIYPLINILTTSKPNLAGRWNSALKTTQQRISNLIKALIDRTSINQTQMAKALSAVGSAKALLTNLNKSTTAVNFDLIVEQLTKIYKDLDARASQAIATEEAETIATLFENVAEKAGSLNSDPELKDIEQQWNALQDEYAELTQRMQQSTFSAELLKKITAAQTHAQQNINAVKPETITKLKTLNITAQAMRIPQKTTHAVKTLHNSFKNTYDSLPGHLKRSKKVSKLYNDMEELMKNIEKKAQEAK